MEEDKSLEKFKSLAKKTKISNDLRMRANKLIEANIDDNEVAKLAATINDQIIEAKSHGLKKIRISHDWIEAQIKIPNNSEGAKLAKEITMTKFPRISARMDESFWQKDWKNVVIKDIIDRLRRMFVNLGYTTKYKRISHSIVIKW